jgi:hypothetical protein
LCNRGAGIAQPCTATVFGSRSLARAGPSDRATLRATLHAHGVRIYGHGVRIAELATPAAFGHCSLTRPRRSDRVTLQGHGVRIAAFGVAALRGLGVLVSLHGCGTRILCLARPRHSAHFNLARQWRSDLVTLHGHDVRIQATWHGHGGRIFEPFTAAAFGSCNRSRPRRSDLGTWDLLIRQTLGNGLDVASWTAWVCPQTGLCLLLEAVKANRTSFKQVVTLCVDKPV